MGRKLDKLMADMQAELDGSEKETVSTEETKPVEAVEEPETEPEPEPVQSDSGESQSDEPTHSDEPEPTETKPEHRDIPDDPVKRAEFSFKRQLAKKDEKHAKELAERDSKYAELEKKFAELEKRLTPAEPPKTRDDFIRGDEGDEAYIQYLTQQKVDAIMAKRDEETAAKEAERLKAEEAKAAEQRELAQRQQEWLDNVDQAFNGDQERSKRFFDRVAFCRKQGLDEVLEGCPVAADYLVNDPMGPVVFEKMINDKSTFERIFNPRRLNPMAIYHELRSVEDEIARGNQQPSVAQPKPVPHLGRPGRQAGGSSIVSTDMFNDPRAVKQWLRDHR